MTVFDDLLPLVLIAGSMIVGAVLFACGLVVGWRSRARRDRD